MLFSSVKNWLTLLIVALVALAMGVAWLYVVPSLGNRLDRQKLRDGQVDAKIISSTVRQFVQYDPTTGEIVIRSTDRTYGSLELTIRLLSMRLNAHIVVLTRALEPSTSTAGLDPFNVRNYPLLAEAVKQKRSAQSIVLTPTGRYAATAVPLLAATGQREIAGVVLVAAPLKDVDKAVAAVQRALLRATGSAIVLSVVLGYLASFFIARRLKRIERSAETIAGGDLTAKVEITVEDEIGQLGSTFNIMAARLRDAFAAVEHERDRIEVLLNDLSEGVIGVAADGAVTIANPAAAELLGRPLAIGALVDDTFPQDVASLWRESGADSTGQAIVFEHGDRTLEATTYPVGGEADVTSIVVLRDVSAQARLERARRDLVANASHEFKTPLFSLAGFLELINEGNLSPEEQQEFLQLMRVQVDRLRNLAVSMLDLSRVEAGSIELEPEYVELDTAARSVLDEFQTQAQAKALTLQTEGGEGLTAWCDEQRLAQVLRALVDNAVKFSPSGRSVRVTVVDEGARAALTVVDEGPGISKLELPHVFERFHRGRDERANSAGAGLGLSIARELTELMGGTMSVASGDGGARFTVRLPRQPAARRGSAGEASGRRNDVPRQQGSGADRAVSAGL
jgi:signal transduction histidine kinase/HAMP domain-containing protein